MSHIVFRGVALLCLQATKTHFSITEKCVLALFETLCVPRGFMLRQLIHTPNNQNTFSSIRKMCFARFYIAFQTKLEHHLAFSFRETFRQPSAAFRLSCFARIIIACCPNLASNSLAILMTWFFKHCHIEKEAPWECASGPKG